MNKHLTLYLVVTFALLITTCQPEREYQPPKPTTRNSQLELDTLSPFRYSKLTIYSFKGCEYLVVGYGDSRWGTHRGDCPNPIHNSEVNWWFR